MTLTVSTGIETGVLGVRGCKVVASSRLEITGCRHQLPTPQAELTTAVNACAIKFTESYKFRGEGRSENNFIYNASKTYGKHKGD